MGVGNYEDHNGLFHGLAEAWTGSHWTTRKVLDSTDLDLDGVACTSASSCTVVGDIDDDKGGLATMAQHWNGSKWALQATPNPSGAADSYLVDMSCSSATACTAVGYWIGRSNHPHPLAERWNGSKWALQAPPGPSGTQVINKLVGVSCPSAASCHAIGVNSSGNGIYTDSWNGSSWKLHSVPVPSGGSLASLSGISCQSAGVCTAVGFFYGGKHDIPLAETWNGSSWSARKPPVPATSGETTLASVSCVSASDCEASGQAMPTGSEGEGLIEHWNGSAWSVQDKVMPSGTNLVTLSGMSCVAGPVCEAAGYLVQTGSGDEKLLALRYS
jgi:hypothetical protein